jgi:GWxTD domain-containing protein
MDRLLLSIVVVLGLVSGCAGSSDPAGGPRSIGSRPGYVAFDVECTPRVTDGRSGVEVQVRIVRPTLAFLKVEGGFEAQITIQLVIVKDDGGPQIAETAWAETLRVATYAETQRDGQCRTQKYVPLAPGLYTCRAMLEDRGTGKMGQRVVPIDVQRVLEGEPTLGSVVLARRVAGAEPEPVVGFHVPIGRDTLFARAPVFNVPIGTRIEFQYTICRFLADTARATVPYLYMPPASALEGNRIAPRRIDTVFIMREQRTLRPDGYILDDPLPLLERGVYQLALHVWGPGQEPTGANAAGSIKYFAAVGPSFPRPVLLKDLLEGCGYIARPNEYEGIDTATTPQSMRSAFDSFWLSMIPDRQRAAAVMRAFYGRMEEANRLFSSFKDGWRTDRGMVFMVLGSPERVEKKLESELWYYTSPGAYQASVLEFRRVYFTEAKLTIEEYVLRRGMPYESAWDRMVERWREGAIY